MSSRPACLTFYRVSARRGGPPHAVGGIVVHDHWKPYYTMPGVLHALCNAHHLRELKALIEIDKEEWARYSIVNYCRPRQRIRNYIAWECPI